ncbi:uncharacterized protein LOC117045386 [Lacerta agilis]|uniref:uncharacterized protein LOC117045386 n=1 Tax=Lacerta agilis TaxID=80427 RepID=UPI00141A1FBB|nr:uncharacterized protein LOC117045386 [Lacerta agilis]
MPSVARLASTQAKAPAQEDYGSLPVRLLGRVSCFQVGTFVLALIGCIMCICSTAGVQWRMWHVDNIMGVSPDLAAGTFVLISVSWNMFSILAKEGMKLPVVLGLPLVPKEQCVGAAIYVGFIAAGSQLLSRTLVLGEKYFWRFRERVTSMEEIVTDPEIVESESPTLRLKCREGASTMKRKCEDRRHMKIESMPNSSWMWLGTAAILELTIFKRWHVTL